jgi:Ca2+-binding EF-hand superfamily protein
MDIGGVRSESASLSISFERTTQFVGGGPGRSQFQQAFSAADANGDGAIDKVELSALYEQAAAKSGRPVPLSVDDTVKALDTDGDESISQAEFQAGVDALGSGRSSAKAESRPLHRVDDGGGRSRRFEKAFAAADANSDGSVDRSELTALYERAAARTGRSVAQSVDETIGALDTDSDGAISKGEFQVGVDALRDGRDWQRVTAQARRDRAIDARSQQVEKLFARLDANGDGGIDTEEIGAEIDRIAAKTDRSDLPSAEQALAKLDADGSGAIGQEELRSALDRRRTVQTQPKEQTEAVATGTSVNVAVQISVHVSVVAVSSYEAIEKLPSKPTDPKVDRTA